MPPTAIPNVTTLTPNETTAHVIGQTLIMQGKLTEADRERVLQQQKESGRRFGEVAVSLGLVQENDVQRVLASQFESPYADSGLEQYPTELVAAHQPFSTHVETLRAIRSQLLLRQIQQARKGLAVVSYNEGDAASYFAANLAVVFSQLHQRTLIIDANLRRPRQHHIFNLKGRPGLADILAGRAGMEAIAQVKHFKNLSVLPAGTPPPNPQELLCRPAFSSLSTAVAERYETVLYDVSTFSECADALIVAFHAGSAMLVAAQHKTRVSDIVSINEKLVQTGADLVGSVLIDT